MSSSSASKYSLQTKPSFIAKVLVMILFLMSAIALILLWGVGWFSSLFLIIYIVAFSHLVYTLRPVSFSCLLSDSGKIEVNEPVLLKGTVSARSFYNGWILFLCVDEVDKLVVTNEQHDKPRKWFVVFNDSVEEREYRLLARLIKSAH